ncbi:MAG: FKBP-type peptidyl-prolyl cis-trans isomerase [Chloroflexota bacterium]
MRKMLVSLLALGLIAGAAQAQEKLQIKDDKDKVSYSVGYQIGGDFKRQHLDLNPDALMQGIKDALAGATPVMTPQEMNQTLMELKTKIVAAQQEERKKMGEKNLAEGKAFLEENAKKEGVKTLPSGLQYKVIKEGDGPMPKATDTVTVHYRGRLVDGTEFDSSYSRNQPATFPVSGVIKGWTEGLQLMKTGAKWELFIPPDLAYGERGAGQVIGPNSALIFEVELVSIGGGASGEAAHPAK